MLIRLSSIVAALAIAAAIAMGTTDAADPATEQRLASIDARLRQLEGVLDNRVLLDMLQRIDDLQRELQAVRDASDRTAHELEGIKDRQRELYLDLDRRLRAVEIAKPSTPAGGIPAAPLKTAPPPLAERSRTGMHSSVAASEAEEMDRKSYESAFNLLKNGRYEESIAALKQFLIQHPNSIYASNAQYWLAEASYASGNYQRAADEFIKVIERYPDSTKVPDARLKLGFTHYGLEQWAQARAVLSELSRQYPNTAVARLAENRLQRMDQEGH